MITPLALGLRTQVYMYVIEHGSIRENCRQPSKDEMANIKKKAETVGNVANLATQAFIAKKICGKGGGSLGYML